MKLTRPRDLMEQLAPREQGLKRHEAFRGLPPGPVRQRWPGISIGLFTPSVEAACAAWTVGSAEPDAYPKRQDSFHRSTTGSLVEHAGRRRRVMSKPIIVDVYGEPAGTVHQEGNVSRFNAIAPQPRSAP
jgi:hypothetical protein